MRDDARPIVNLQHLRCFEAIYRLRNLTRAADSLQLTQSAMSKSLSCLRDEYGDALFVRAGGTMEPTPKAHSMIEPIRSALRIIDVELKSGARFDPSSAMRSFALCCSDLGTLYFLPKLLAHLRSHAPGVRLHVLPPAQTDMALGLAHGDIDLVLGAYPDLGSGIFTQHLFDDSYSCLLSAQHPRIKKNMTPEGFVNERHLVASNLGSGHQHAQIERRIVEACGPERIVARVPTFLAGSFMLEDTDLLLTLPTASAKRFTRASGLRMVPCPLQLPPLEVRQYWHERVQHDAAHQWLRQLVFDLFGAGASPTSQ
jgi:DNA-binding transcriptional LysR family regulator